MYFLTKFLRRINCFYIIKIRRNTHGKFPWVFYIIGKYCKIFCREEKGRRKKYACTPSLLRSGDEGVQATRMGRPVRTLHLCELRGVTAPQRVCARRAKRTLKVQALHITLSLCGGVPLYNVYARIGRTHCT